MASAIDAPFLDHPTHIRLTPTRIVARGWAAPAHVSQSVIGIRDLSGDFAMQPMTIDTGNTAFMLLCSSLVMLMTPGLAFFYGGLVGRKNVLAIMIQSFVSMGWTTVLWWAFGFSMCFSGDL
jgi:hypothetical protein